MPTLRLNLPVPRLLIGEVIQKIRYSMKEIADFALSPQSPDQVSYRLTNGADRRAIEQKLEGLIDEMCRGFRGIPVKRLFENKLKHRRIEGVWKKLAEKGELFAEGPGQVALSGRALALFNYFDGIFQKWAAKMEFLPAMYPALIGTEILDRAEYFNSFPQYLTFAAHLPEDSQAIEQSIQRFKSKKTAGIDGLATARQVLSPAVCYHVYPQIADSKLRSTHRITAVGKCFRYETVNMSPLERQWDFWMRELVQVGSPDGVEQFRQDLLKMVKNLVKKLELAGYIESAHDPFFTAESAGKLVLQRLKHLKFELRLELEEEDKSSAVASFNNHEDFFGRTFAVQTRGGAPAHSGCVAFGLERWVNAFLCQHGLEPSRWPDAVARVVAPRRR